MKSNKQAEAESPLPKKSNKQIEAELPPLTKLEQLEKRAKYLNSLIWTYEKGIEAQQSARRKTKIELNQIEHLIEEETEVQKNV